ncbi:MAG: hypothetical protein RJB11_2644, partial [Planctomycetota bacterium]
LDVGSVYIELWHPIGFEKNWKIVRLK